MSASTPPRRVRVERNIYRRTNGVFEVGFKDSAGVQRWRTVQGGIMAARALRDELLARRGRGEAVPANPRLRFGEAADRWLHGPVADLRESTQAGYRNAVERHLCPRFGGRRLDAIGPDDLAALVRDMRAACKSEATIAVAVSVAGRVYKFAARRLGWHGTNPTTLMLTSERPKVSLAKRMADLHGRADRGDDRGGYGAVPHAAHCRCAHECSHVRALRSHLGRRTAHRPRRR
jgi:Phage integrase, N-terminal SAM-like domain